MEIDAIFLSKKEFHSRSDGGRSFCPKITKKVPIYEMRGKKNGDKTNKVRLQLCVCDTKLAGE